MVQPLDAASYYTLTGTDTVSAKAVRQEIRACGRPCVAG